MSRLLALPVVLPLIGAALSILVGRSRTAQRAISLTVLTANLAIAVVLLIEVDRDGTLVTQAGGWEAPLGITLIADRLAAIMLTVGSLMLLVVLVYAIGQPGAERDHVGFQSVYLVLAAGVSGSFLTGDLFNLFVTFEMMLTASYVLLTLGGRRDQVRAGMTYVVISLLASALFITALALLYAATGTVNMADLAAKVGELPQGVRTGFAVLLLVVFGIKAALFPLYFWLPDSYPTAPSPVVAVFAGLLTKVGVYAIIRTQTLLFPEDSRPTTLMLWLAGLTMLVGILGAIAQGDVKRILSFNIVSHIGYMIMGLALFTVAGLAAAILYVVHHIVAKTTLFLTGGLIEHVGGSSRLSRLGDMVRTAPVVAVLFLVPALALMGIPPFSGFVPKFALVDAGLAADQPWIVGVSLVVSLLTIFSLLKIWSGVFWNPATEDAELRPYPTGRFGGPPLMVLPTAGLAVVGLAIAVASGPLYDLCARAAEDLLDPAAYIDAVLGGAVVTHPAVVIAVLVTIWVLGWGDLSVANVLSGIAVAGLVIAVSPIGRIPERRGHTLRPVAAVRLLGFFVVELLRSNVAMARDLLGARSRIRTGIVAYPLRTRSDGLATFLVTVLTLTPGTMPLELSGNRDEPGPRVMYLHLTRMHEREAILRIVARYEELAVRAFGSPAEVAAVSSRTSATGASEATP